jgi:hypothetical protein
VNAFALTCHSSQVDLFLRVPSKSDGLCDYEEKGSGEQ